jgi:hypothetical protein
VNEPRTSDEPGGDVEKPDDEHEGTERRGSNAT